MLVRGLVLCFAASVALICEVSCLLGGFLTVCAHFSGAFGSFTRFYSGFVDIKIVVGGKLWHVFYFWLSFLDACCYILCFLVLSEPSLCLPLFSHFSFKLYIS